MTPGNRTLQTGGGCGATVTAVSRAYSGADQPLTGGNGQGFYGYVPLGRQLMIPAADTASPGSGDIGLGYFDTDAARWVSQGDVRVVFGLDGAGRRLSQTTTVGPVVDPARITAGTLVRHYTDGSDNPTWSVDTRGTRAVTTRYAGLTGDGLGITFTTTDARVNFRSAPGGQYSRGIDTQGMPKDAFGSVDGVRSTGSSGFVTPAP